MKRFTQYDGLYGEVGPIQAGSVALPRDASQPGSARSAGEYLFSELLETRSRTFEWVIQPHIHARLFQAFFVESGQVAFSEATQTRQLVGPVVLLIPPTALHGFVYSSDCRGRILTLSDSLLAELFPAESPVWTMLTGIQCLIDFNDRYSPQVVNEFIVQVDNELFADLPEKRMMLHACLRRLFLVLFRLWQHNKTQQSVLNNVTMAYFRHFQQRLLQVGTTHTIVQFANDLAITPVHLNRICRAVSGKSASQLVQEYVIHEACKYLTYTNYSVSEIAYLLHFEYPNYFAKFFKKHTQLSPTEFREQPR